MSREGSDSEVDLANADFRFTAESGLNSDIATCPLCAHQSIILPSAFCGLLKLTSRLKLN
jgi:hypothetical protein